MVDASEQIIRFVVKYLFAHGSVSPTAKIVHHVFPGEPGSSILAGKLNGNRSYLVDLKGEEDLKGDNSDQETGDR